jgi:hypothetical protein
MQALLAPPLFRRGVLSEFLRRAHVEGDPAYPE